jgi:hypothetical protein
MHLRVQRRLHFAALVLAGCLNGGLESGAAAEDCSESPSEGIAFVMAAKDPATQSMTEADIQGKKLCVVTYPLQASPVTTVVVNKADLGWWFVDLGLSRSEEVWSIYSPVWKHVMARLSEKDRNATVTLGTAHACARKAELALYPTVLVAIDVQGVVPQSKGDIVFKSFDAQYVPDVAGLALCAINPSQAVAADKPLQFKLATTNDRAVDGTLRVEVRTEKAPLVFNIPLPELYDKESFQLLDYAAQSSPKSTAITRNLSDEKSARSPFLSSVTITRKIVPWTN